MDGDEFGMDGWRWFGRGVKGGGMGDGMGWGIKMEWNGLGSGIDIEFN
jgi:hypothetical protein